MTKNEDPKKESLAEIAVDPDVLARELALEIEIDPLEQIDEDAFSKNLNISLECDEALKLLKGNREERIQGLRIFCEYRDQRSFPLLLPLLDQPCPVERMSAVYALGRNPCPSAVQKLVSLLMTDDYAYVRRATAWSLANYDNHIVLLDLRSINMTGKIADLLVSEVNITANKNTVPFDPESPFVTSGLRLGTAALTTRGFNENAFAEVGEIIADRLLNPDDSLIESQCKERVLTLCNRFPLNDGKLEASIK